MPPFSEAFKSACPLNRNSSRQSQGLCSHSFFLQKEQKWDNGGGEMKFLSHAKECFGVLFVGSERTLDAMRLYFLLKDALMKTFEYMASISGQ